MTAPVLGRVEYEVRDVEGKLIFTTPEQWLAEGRANARKEKTGQDADVFKVQRISSTGGEYMIAAPNKGE
jgi:hypothetical protein